MFGNVMEDPRTNTNDGWNTYVTHLEEQVYSLESSLDPSSSDEKRPTSTSSSSDDSRPTHAELAKKLDVIPVDFSSTPLDKINAAEDPSLPGSLKYAAPDFTNTLLSSMGLKPAILPMYESRDVDLCGTPKVLPPKAITESLLSTYFAIVNSQFPILHREQFLIQHFEPIYGDLSPGVSLANDSDVFSDTDRVNYEFMSLPPSLNPSPVNSRESSPIDTSPPTTAQAYVHLRPELYSRDLPRSPEDNRISFFFLNICLAIALCLKNEQFPTETPHEYYQAAMRHATEAIDNNKDKMQALQAALLLVVYGTLRPIKGGVFTVLRRCIHMVYDLKLHIDTTELSAGSAIIDSHMAHSTPILGNSPLSRPQTPNLAPIQGDDSSSFSSLGGSAFQDPRLDLTPLGIEMRRRLFWSAYCLDKLLLGPYGREFEIPVNLCATVPFPSAADDKFLTYERVFIRDQDVRRSRSYKSISHALFSIRVMQAKIRDALYVEKTIPCHYDTWDHWQKDMREKLDEWYNTCPTKSYRTNCQFNFHFFKIQYTQTKMMIYGVPLESLHLFDSQSLPNLAKSAVEALRAMSEALTLDSIDGNSLIGIRRIYLASVNYVYALFNSPDARSRASINEINWMASTMIRLFNVYIPIHHSTALYVRAMKKLFRITADMYRQERNEPRHN